MLYSSHSKHLLKSGRCSFKNDRPNRDILYGASNNDASVRSQKDRGAIPKDCRDLRPSILRRNNPQETAYWYVS
nr:hypothetical protein [Arthrobacter sp. B1805]